MDSSVWIDLLNNVVTEPVRRLRELIPATPLLIGDLILLEVLQGFRNEAQAKLVGRSLRRFEPAALLDPELAVKAAAYYRFLRRRGITIRKSIDLVMVPLALSAVMPCCTATRILSRWSAFSAADRLIQRSIATARAG